MFDLVMNVANLFYVSGNQFAIVRKMERDREKKEKRSLKKREREVKRGYSFLISSFRPKTHLLSSPPKKNKTPVLITEGRGSVNNRLRSDLYI